MNLLGCPFCAKCKENKFQSAGARKTARKTHSETTPATCRTNTKTLIWAPKNDSKIRPQSLPEACRMPLAPQDATKSSKPRPKRPQERAKSAPRAPGTDFHDFPGPGGGSQFWSLRGWPGNLGGRVLEGSAPWNGVFASRLCRCSCFSGLLEKMAFPKATAKALSHLNFFMVCLDDQA